MTRTDLIKRAIESARCRLYKVRARDSYSIDHQQKAENQTEIMNITIEALEKQIPKKVIRIKGDIYAKTKDGKEAYVYENKCPSCRSIETIKGYPCRCGQALDWSDEE